MGKTEIDAFLSYLATDRKASASTQRQALNAIIFLYKHVLDMPVSGDIEPVRAKKNIRPPVVMSKNEVQRVFAQEDMHFYFEYRPPFRSEETASHPGVRSTESRQGSG